MNSSAILDVAILAVLALFALLGAKKGFFRMLADAVMVLAASIGARIISNMFAARAAALLAPIVKEQVLRRLEEALGDTLRPFASLGEDLIAQATEQLTLAMAQSLLFLAAFAVLMIGLKIFVGTTDLLLHLPVLRQCNELLGALVGLAVGCLAAVIVTRVCLTFGWYITDEMAAGSIFMGIFSKVLHASA